MEKKSLLGTDVVAQIGIIVKDIEKTSKTFAEFFGVDVPSVDWTDEFDKAQTHYKGKPVKSRAKLAFFEMGNIQLELIEPDEHPSTWREFLENHGEGVHHIAFVVNGMKQIIANMENQNMPLVQTGEYEGGRYAYMDSFDQLKVILELLEND
ncbi:VOC family protein [Gracilibacillus sp. D59]|uniref:VOC family protein n=1 Tax=Gracilibacillus sp. D59 TaxID=3457434 RepID=UPI003FCDE9FD